MKLNLLKLSQCSLLIVTFCGVLRTDLYASGLDEANADSRIALVVGTPIYSHELTNEFSQAKQIFLTQFGRQPSDEEIIKFRQTLREKSFIKKVKSIIYKKVEAEWNIEVSENEINKKWSELTSGADFNLAAKSQHDFYLPLFEAVMEVQISNVPPDISFTNKLQNKMSKSEWEAHLKYFCTPKRLEFLSNLVYQTAQDIQKPDPSIKFMLIDQKVNEKIDAEISKEDSEYVKQKNLFEKDPANKQAISYLNLKKDNWWKAKYKSLNIEVFDTELNNFWKKRILDLP